MGTINRKIPGLRLRNDVYYADTTANGVRLTQRIGKVTEKVAKAILAKLISQAFEHAYFPPKEEKKQLTINLVCDEYCVKKLAYLKSKSTRLHLFKPISRILGNVVASELRISSVEEYRRIRLTEKKQNSLTATVSISTVNHEVKELLMALQWAVKERLIEFNPIAGIDHLREPEPKRIMLDKGEENGVEWLKLYNLIGERNRHSGKLTIRGKRDRLRFLIQYNTGMRIGEVNQLQHNWIDLINLQIALPAEITKSGKSRTIPINIDMAREITSFKEEIRNTVYSNNVYLFYNPRTKNHDARAGRAFANAVKRAGLSENITTHALRRTRGTIWDGIDERASMEALGHSDFKVHRKHYTVVTENRIRALVDKPSNTHKTVAHTNTAM